MGEIELYYNYFKSNSLEYNNINPEILFKFISLVIQTPNIITKQDKEKFNIILNNYNLKSNYRLQLLWYTINLDNKNKKLEFLNFYYHNDPSQMFENLEILKLIYPDLKNYVKDFKFIFNDNYFNQSIMYQKAMIYFFYTITTSIYPRGLEHKYYFKVLYKVFKRFIKDKNEEMVFYLYVPLIMTSNAISTTQKEFKKFNDKVELKLEKLIKKVIIPKYNIKKQKIIENNSDKIKVAFLIESSTWHSVNQVFYSLLESLKKESNDRYEFIILNMEAPELGGTNKIIESKFISLGFKYYNLHQITNSENSPFYNQIEKVLKIREFIISESISIIVNIGNLHSLHNFIFTTRTSNKQIFWSHGNFEFDIDGIDKRICHFSNYNKRFDFSIFSLSIDIDRYNPKIDKKIIDSERLKYPKDKFILGFIGRLIKINDDRYLKTVSEIMKKNPNTIYLACGSGNQLKIKEKIKKLGISNRFYFTGHIDSHVYGQIIDLWLEPLSHNSGEALQEYMYKGNIFLMLYKEWTYKERNHSDYDAYSKYVWPDSVDKYISIATKIINNKYFRNYLINRSKINLKNTKNNNALFVNILDD